MELNQLMKKKILYAVKILTAISAVIALASVMFQLLLRIYISNKYQLSNANAAASIGIIGGADGPTVIYVSDHSSFNLLTLIAVIITIAGIVFQILIKNHLKKLT